MVHNNKNIMQCFLNINYVNKSKCHAAHMGEMRTLYM